jgi:predicted transcriptional regulator
MLEPLFNSRIKEQVLIYLRIRKEGYARQIAKYYTVSLSSVQKQLDKLEFGNILVSKSFGRTRVYYYNPRYPFLKELFALIDKAFQFLPLKQQQELKSIRKRPRRKGKPI